MRDGERQEGCLKSGTWIHPSPNGCISISLFLLDIFCAVGSPEGGALEYTELFLSSEIFLSVTLTGIWWQSLNASHSYWGHKHPISQIYSFIFQRNLSLNSLAQPWLAGGRHFWGIFSRLVLHWCIFGCRLESVVLSQNECHNVCCWGCCTVCLCVLFCAVWRYEYLSSWNTVVVPLRDDPDFCVSSVRVSHPVASAFVPFKLLSQWVFVFGAQHQHDIKKKKKKPHQTRQELESGTCCAASSAAATVQPRSTVKAFFWAADFLFVCLASLIWLIEMFYLFI